MFGRPPLRGGGGRTTPNPGSRGDKIRRPPQKNTFLNDPPPGGRGDKIHSPPPKVYFLDGHYPCGNRTLRATLLFPQGMGVRPKSVFGRGGADFVAPYPRGGVGGFVQKVFGGGRRIFPLYPQGWGGVQISVLGGGGAGFCRPLQPRGGGWGRPWKGFLGVAPDFLHPTPQEVGVGGRPNKCIWGGRAPDSVAPYPPGVGVGSSIKMYFGGGARFSPPSIFHWRRLRRRHFFQAVPAAPPLFSRRLRRRSSPVAAPAAPPFDNSEK